MRVLDLFSGIGGFSVGLERAGMRTIAFCEIDAYCRRVLSKNWPDVPCYDDARTLTGARLTADGLAVDVIAGGFPCQDVSLAGKRAGLEGARSGLWGEYRRLVGEVRPRYVIVENVPGLLSLGMGTVLGDLSALGYDAVWDCIPASAVGAPHRRDRVWLVAYSGRAHGERRQDVCAGDRDTNGSRPENRQETIRTAQCSNTWAVADADRDNEYGRRGPLQVGRERGSSQVAQDGDAGRAQWSIEPDVGRVAHGVPARVDRLRCLGNAIVPQVAELLGRVICEIEAGT